MEAITPPPGGMPFAVPTPGVGPITWQQSASGMTGTGIPPMAEAVTPAGLMRVGEELQRAQCAALLQRLDAWLEATVPHMPQLADVIPATVQAVQLYAGGQYQAGLAQACGVVQILSQMRAMYPALPPL